MQRWRLAAAVVGERCFTTIMLLVNILGGYPDGSEVNYYGLSVVKTSGREKKTRVFCRHEMDAVRKKGGNERHSIETSIVWAFEF